MSKLIQTPPLKDKETISIELSKEQYNQFKELVIQMRSIKYTFTRSSDLDKPNYRQDIASLISMLLETKEVKTAIKQLNDLIKELKENGK